jgi:hypothetical protein
MDAALRKACSATSTSHRWASYDCATTTLWPSSLSNLAQRSAVVRFPCRDRGGAGVTMQILNRRALPDYSTAQVRKPAMTSRRSGVK